MKSHIRHTSQKSMGLRSASGRLLTIAFLCLFLTALVIAQSAFAGTLRVVIPLSDRNGVNNVVPINASTSIPLPGGACYGDCTYIHDGQVNFLATADTGWSFFQWTTAPGTPINATQSNPSANIDIFPPDSITVTGDFIQTYQITNISGGTVSESDGTAIFTVTLDREPAVGDEVTVDYATGAGGDTAVANSDYTITSGTLTFNNGTTASLTIPVPILNDTLVEPSESFTVTLSNPSVNATIANATATGTITDNDSAAVTVEDVSAAEGGGLVFTVTLDNAVAGAFTVTPALSDVSATGGVDYTNAPPVLNFAGTSGETQQFTVTTTNDAVLEGDETFAVSLSASNALVNDSDTATGTITDNDSAAVTVEDVSAAEGGGLVFTVTLDNAVAGAFTVTPALSDVSATGGVDYTNAPPVLNFAGTSGETQQFTVTTTNDAVLEGDETFAVSLSASNALVNDSDTATGTITDNDSAAVTVEDVSAAEGGGLVFTVTLDNAVAGAFTVTPALSDVSATGGVDYTNAPPVLNFAGTSGETQQFTVTTTNDAVLEGDETFAVSLSASNALVNDSDTATGTITDNDSAAVTVEDVSAAEGGGLVFTVTLDNAVAGAFTVTPALSDVSATGGVDYTNAPPVLNFAGTSGETQQFTVTTTNDAVLEGDETFAVSLSASNALVNDSDTATGTITDNDSAAVTVEDVSAAEGGGLVFTVTLDNAVAGAFTVTPALSDVSATGGVDYTNAPPVLNFAGTSGETQQFTVTTTNDAVLEGDETFAVSLSASNALVNDSDTATGTITDNDSAAVTVEDVSAAEGGGLVFTVTLDNAVAGAFTVTPALSDVSATGGVDYTNAPPVLNFAGTSGETQQFTVTTTNDAVLEGDETFAVSLSASNALVNDSDTATGTITDNDSAAVTVEDVSAAEGGGLVFTVTLDNAVAGAFTVTPALSDVSATGGVDYTNAPPVLNFAGTSGETQQFTVTTTNDAVLEGDETFAVSLSASNALVNDSDTATGTITDNDSAAVTVEDVSAAEGGGLVFTVTLDNAVAGAFTVTPALSDVSATGGVDYTNAPPVLNFAGTSGETQQFTVTTTNDAVLEGDETFAVSLSASNALVNDSDTATGTITDNDSAAVTVEDVSAAEGGGLVFTVTLDNAVAGAFTVTPALSDVSATGGVDYTNAPPVLNFAGTSGETQQFTVTTTNDAVLEGDETFAVSLSASNALVNDSDTATGTITDNDSAAVTVEDVSAAEGGGLVFTVTLDNAVAGAFTVTPALSRCKRHRRCGLYQRATGLEFCRYLR